MLDVLSAGDLMEELCSEYLWNPKNIGRVYESIPELSRLLKDNEGSEIHKLTYYQRFTCNMQAN